MSMNRVWRRHPEGIRRLDMTNGLTDPKTGIKTLFLIDTRGK